MNCHSPFTVIAIAEAKPGKEQELQNTLLSLIEPTRREEGCINYTLYQNNDNPAKFMFYEDWESQTSHAKHRLSSHMKAWRSKKDCLLIAPAHTKSWKMIK